MFFDGPTILMFISRQICNNSQYLTTATFHHMIPCARVRTQKIYKNVILQ